MKAEFDQFADLYRKNLDDDLSLTGGTSGFFAHYKAKKLLQFTNQEQSTPKRILDFGCGDGLMTKEIHTFFPKSEVYGVDPSPEILKLAQRNCPNATFKTSDKKLNLFNNKKFDLIFSAMVFHHIPFNEHEHYLNEITSMLSPGGLFVIFELNPFNPMAQYIINTASIDVNAHMLMPWYTKKLMRSYGEVTTQYCAFIPPVLKSLLPLENYISRIPLGAFVVTILKKS